ncbi:beta-N-acetylhexosaminidase [Allocatelliglobosispora scoriae]|uniref:Beta-N-acetylhexosaminidase n=1 Tax=Allocatelliglobosispora scoriae TaxID=643052 RepID=A0A841C1P3_9ACTN|nr:glycoside hydrolase family 3 protein [Allocatelliglobosispora scoriae]MBB5873063.1 beta-N-acetylhexosaminidase [Allocatelliglobosispora scoriae]
MATNVKTEQHLATLADAVLQPGFVGTSPPDWLRRRLAAGLGGVALFSRNIADPEQLAGLTRELRAENPGVVIAVDEESGDVTRLDVQTGSTRPGNHALGAVDDLALTEAVAADIGAQLAAAGITLNYAPTSDVNSNPDNPVIGVRSFGADPELVARHTAAWVRGLQSAGVAACAKHFPGHGDTAVDSHHGLPIVLASTDRLTEVELVPFRAAIAAGTRAIMTAHLLLPALDPALPATLSPRVLVKLLREELGYTGLVITDGIEMASIKAEFGLAGATVRAIAAGADAVCVGGDTADEEAALMLRDALVAAVLEGVLPEERLAEAAGRVAALAEWTAAQAANRQAAALRWGSGEVGLAAARRAVRVTGQIKPLTTGAHVVELATTVNMAIDAGTPWGVGAPLAALLPGTTVERVDSVGAANGSLPHALQTADGRPLVLVVRDAHRHEWMARTLAVVLARRPDTIVVEMGVPTGEPLGAVHLATHGAAQVCGRAAAELLTGMRE